LNGHPEIEQAAINAIHTYGTGTGGARLLSGSNELHRTLESKLAQFTGKEAAMTVTSGYLANIAVVSALIQKADRVIADEYIHRSIADALSMAQVNYEKFKHNDMADLRQLLENGTEQKTFVITEGVYSMDGDICPLPQLVELKSRFNFFIILDESHALGTLGDTGKGTCEHFGISPSAIDVITSSLYKAIPAGGGFIAASMQVIIYLRHGASPYMFSTSLSPVAAGAACAALDIIEREGQHLVKQLRDNINYLKKGLNHLGYNTGHSESAVIPVIIGQKEKTLLLSATLFSLGFLATPVVFPAVAPGGDRLRLCATAAQSKEVLDKIIDAFAVCMQLTVESDKAA
jgi:8-amino-7-oxononanoate synthase